MPSTNVDDDYLTYAFLVGDLSYARVEDMLVVVSDSSVVESLDVLVYYGAPMNGII